MQAPQARFDAISSSSFVPFDGNAFFSQFKRCLHAGSAHFQLSFHTVTEEFPRSFRAVAEAFPRCFRVVSALFPYRFRAFPSQFQRSFHMVSAEFPNSFRSVPAPFLKSFRRVSAEFPSTDTPGMSASTPCIKSPGRNQHTGLTRQVDINSRHQLPSSTPVVNSGRQLRASTSFLSKSAPTLVVNSWRQLMPSTPVS